MHSTLLFYNQRCFTIKTNTSDGCFRKTFTYNGKRYSVRVKTARDLWHKVEEKSSGYLFTQPATGRPHTETSMKQMWRSFKQALDLDMGAQMASGAIDPETSLWLMISRRTACGIHTRLICSPPTCRSTLQRTFWAQVDCHDVAYLYAPLR